MLPRRSSSGVIGLSLLVAGPAVMAIGQYPTGMASTMAAALPNNQNRIGEGCGSQGCDGRREEAVQLRVARNLEGGASSFRSEANVERSYTSVRCKLHRCFQTSFME